MRTILALLLFMGFSTVHAQLSVGADAGAGSLIDVRADMATELLPIRNPSVFVVPNVPGTRVRATPADQTQPLTATAFDFSAAKPYLAFFCRLELDIEEATRFPVRFRLGEVRGWQQELSKRD